MSEMTVSVDPLTLFLPSPVSCLLREKDKELWLKDDGRIGPVYGGNKARKLGPILKEARARGIRRLVSAGVAGSHHVLALGLLGRALNMEVTAFALPRPWSAHAEDTLRRTQAAGVELVPLGQLGDLRHWLGLRWRAGDHWVAPGAASTVGASAYAEAIPELLEQIAKAEIPTPDCIVVAVGTGGTAAGLLAGLVAAGLPTKVLGVDVMGSAIPRFLVKRLAARVLSRMGRSRSGVSERFVPDRRWIGRGYGHPTDDCDAAIKEAARHGLHLESTYTGKAFAAALDLLETGRWPSGLPVLEGREAGRPLRVLFWSTLADSSSPPAAPSATTLDPSLPRLLQRE